MKRATFSVLALLALVPCHAAAQGVMTGDPEWGARVRLTPFVGQAPSVTRGERWVVLEGNNASFGDFDVDLGSGSALGASVEFRAVDRFAIIAAGTYVSRGQTREFSFSDGEFLVSEGSNFIYGKVAAALRLREAMSEMQLRRLTATVFAGPAFVRESPKDDPSVSPLLRESLTHWAANFGIDAEIPMGNGLVAFQLGLEDYYTFWNTGELASRNDRAFAAAGFTTQTSVEADASHTLLVRLGLTFRFR